MFNALSMVLPPTQPEPPEFMEARVALAGRDLRKWCLERALEHVQLGTPADVVTGVADAFLAWVLESPPR